MSARSWRWLRSRILGLLTAPVGHDFAGNSIFANRLQAALMPQPDESREAK